MCCVVLYCVALSRLGCACVVQVFPVLSCSVLQCIVLYSIELYCFVLFCIVLN